MILESGLRQDDDDVCKSGWFHIGLRRRMAPAQVIFSTGISPSGVIPKHKFKGLTALGVHQHLYKNI